MLLLNIITIALCIVSYCLPSQANFNEVQDQDLSQVNFVVQALASLFP